MPKDTDPMTPREIHFIDERIDIEEHQTYPPNMFWVDALKRLRDRCVYLEELQKDPLHGGPEDDLPRKRE